MGHMSAAAKILNKQPKTNSKSHKEKEAKRLALMGRRIGCEKCGRNTTLYNKQGHYYCKECK